MGKPGNPGVPKLSHKELNEVILNSVLYHAAPSWIAHTCCTRLLVSFANWLYTHTIKETAFLLSDEELSVVL